MLAVKKRPLATEPMYFDFSTRLASDEILVAVDTAPVMILPSITNTDLAFSSPLLINSSGPTYPPAPAQPIAINKGVLAIVSGGALPADPTSLESVLPDGTVGTLYEFSFQVTTSLIVNSVSRVISEQFQLWVSNDDYPNYWSSNWELSRRYSATAVNNWADADNTNAPGMILANIWAAVAEATDDMRVQLRGSPCGIITPMIAAQSTALRRNCTMLAASILYRARGVRDTSDEEGRDRFSSDVKRVEKFIKRCRAGQIRLIDGDVGVTTHPFVGMSVVPYLTPSGPLLTPSEMLTANQWSELQGIPSYNSWFNSFDTFWWGLPQ